MPWCPNCNSEYREGFTKCSECGANLVEEPAPKESDEEQVLLKNVENDFEADIVQSLLKSNGIESTRIHKGAGEFLKIYMGGSNFGVDIYVLESDYEEAKQLLESQILQNDEISDENPENSEEQFTQESDDLDLSKGNKVRRFSAWLVLLTFAAPIVIGLIFIILVFVYLVLNHY